MTSRDVVTMEDVRAMKWCASGARELAKTHGLDFRKFVREGISCDEMLATGDGMAEQIVKYVRERNARHG